MISISSSSFTALFAILVIVGIAMAVVATTAPPLITVNPLILFAYLAIPFCAARRARR